jgi:integrase
MMNAETDFGRHLDAYLAIRDALGFAAGTRAQLLRSFLDHALGATAPGLPIRATTAVAWACDHAPPGCGDAGKAHRLMIARGFLTYLSAVVPGTEVPAHGLLAGHRRRRPYIFSDNEIVTLTAVAATAQPRDGLRPSMLATLLGLLASTGLRIGEAIRLTMEDVQLEARPAHLRVLQSKFRKSRLVPVDPTTATALASYVQRRQELGYHALSEVFFVNERGGQLDAGLLGRWFDRLTRKAGLLPIEEGARRPSLHSFRHSFAVRRLRAWHEAGRDVQSLLPTLSVYLGHVRPEDTYWYLTATPDLLRAAGSRFTPDGVLGVAP